MHIGWTGAAAQKAKRLYHHRQHEVRESAEDERRRGEEAIAIGANSRGEDQEKYDRVGFPRSEPAITTAKISENQQDATRNVPVRGQRDGSV
eukprot:IDg19132t1